MPQSAISAKPLLHPAPDRIAKELARIAKHPKSSAQKSSLPNQTHQGRLQQNHFYHAKNRL